MTRDLRSRVIAVLRRHGFSMAKFRTMPAGVPDQLLRPGVTVKYLPGFASIPNGRDPVRTFRLQVATLRADLRTLVGRGKAEVERTPRGGTVRLRYRAKGKP